MAAVRDGSNWDKLLVAAYFPSGTSNADAISKLKLIRGVVIRRLHQTFPKNTTAHQTVLGDLQRYSRLTLSGEKLLVVEISFDTLTPTTEVLQEFGATSVFVTGLAPGDAGNEAGSQLAITTTNELVGSVDRTLTKAQGALDYLVSCARLGRSPSPSGQWIVDNFYLVRTGLAGFRKALKQLTKSVRPQRLNALAEMARCVVRDTPSRVNEEVLVQFLDAAQGSSELTSAELWAFPLFLRMALLEQVSFLAMECAQVQRIRDAALLWANRLAAASVSSGNPLDQMLARLSDEPLAENPTFMVALAEGLQDQGAALEAFHSWITTKGTHQLLDLVRSEHERESADALRASNVFANLKTLSQIEFPTVFEVVSAVEAVLRRDPSEIYAQSDATTRGHCRDVVSLIASQSNMLESEVARQALQLAREQSASAQGVLYYLISSGVTELETATQAGTRFRQRVSRLLKRHSTGLYVCSTVALTIALLTVVMSMAWDAGIRQAPMLTALTCLAAFPISELAIQILHSLLINTFPPAALPKLDFRLGVPDDAATLVVVPMMLSSEETIRREAEKLEIRYLANRGANITYSLFSDFVDAAEATMPSDGALLQTARGAIDALNEKYGGDRFVLFHRPRSWSKTQQLWIGRERKRGKIEDLNAYLCGHGDSRIIAAGKAPNNVRYVICLDADTQLPPGVAVRLIETIAHPLNRVDTDPETGVRRCGYAIIQPRVGISLPGAMATRFTRVFSDSHGTDPYCMVVSDAQQDLCGEAIFHGKAIYDVHAFDRILRGRFQGETILSHDLIEGAHVGVGFASDVELLEGLPLDYPSYAKRQHRWIRGDWQIAGWIFPRVRNEAGETVANPLSWLNRWRILDNLRRSLVPIASLLLVGFGWFFSVAPLVWSLVLALTVGIPALVPVLDRWTRRLEGSVHTWRGATDDLVRTALMIIFLPHQAWLSADAIARACHRSLITRRNLLEWQTAEASQETMGFHREATMRQMLIISVGSAVALVLLAIEGAFAPTSIYLGLWICAPWLMRWLGRRGSVVWRAPLFEEQSTYLRILARRTWRYFDDLVGEASNWLPPDNSQVALRIEVAQRTSPTNIGLWLNSALAAWDFGYITADEFAGRCMKTMQTVRKLGKYEGHLLNWYDTRSLAPLQPEYVSTVDSGNLVTSLWVLAQGCREIAKTPVVNAQAVRGLRDSIDTLRGAAGADPSLPVPIQLLRETSFQKTRGIEQIGQLRLLAFHSDRLKGMKRWAPRAGDETTYWGLKLASELDCWNGVIDRYLAWMELASGPSDALLSSMGGAAIELRREAIRTIPTLQELAAGPPTALAQLLRWLERANLRPEVREWLESMSQACDESRKNAAALVETLRQLEAEATALARSIRMDFLYDPARKLFGIGYSVGMPVTFTSHYDLLASECRLASLVSIAKGDIPVEHWFHLGRQQGATSHGGLLSWSGTMFEYLMPALFTEMFESTLLAHACDEAVAGQIAYGNARDLPWGISEAAYSALDSNKTYQYRAFGIPGFALNPNADPGPVISPYSTVLALLLRPQDAYSNLQRLESAGLGGAMGFYEAIDYTRPKDETDDKSGVPIYAYMAHHQGMSLMALCNVLCEHSMQRRFHADVRIRAVESLLFERVPIVRADVPEPTQPALALEAVPAPDRQWVALPALPKVHLNSNGRYSVMVTSNGGGYSRWRNFDISRWRPDGALDGWGNWLWVKDRRSGAVWSPASKPNGLDGEGLVTFACDRAEFARRLHGVEVKTEIAVATDDDAELRRITISNRSIWQKNLELTSYLELVLAPHEADVAHPVFSKMFIETECPEEGLLIARRRLRSPEDPPIWAAYVVVGYQGALEFETDRRRFLGRAGSAGYPVALDGNLSGTAGAALDPIFSFRIPVRLEAHERRILCLVTIAAASREALMEIVRKYQRPNAAEHAFEMIWTRTQLEFRFLRIGAAAAHRYQDLAGYILYPSEQLRARVQLESNRLGQSALWKYGISGDRPILTLTVSDEQAIGLVREVLLAHSYWGMLGLAVDLVILNREPQSYDSPLRKVLDRLAHAHSGWPTGTSQGSVFVLTWQDMLPADRTHLLAVGRVALGGYQGTLQQQLLLPASVVQTNTQQQKEASRSYEYDAVPSLEPLKLLEPNGLGGFTADGREYVIDLVDGRTTPVPWANVIANPHFGTVVTESGLGFTYSGNSQMNRLTPWHNDPVADPQSEIIYLRDDESGAVWSATPRPIHQLAPYRIRHGQGYSVWEHASHGIEQELTVFAALDKPVKLLRLRLKNVSGRARRVSTTYFAELVLGAVQEKQAPHIVTSFNAAAGVLLARQSWSELFSTQAAFLSSSPAASSYTADRRTFWGSSSADDCPESLTRTGLDNRAGAGLDPCAALQLQLKLAIGEERDVIFVFGETDSAEHALALSAEYAQVQAIDAELARVHEWWDRELGVIQVETPNASTDVLLNRWLLYQSLACRLWARSAIYQSGGAIGFRDQLQDSLALIYSMPELTRRHILNAASRQFPEGDVQHWWHVESGLGVRTRCSDDLLWLPWVVARYIDITKDNAILEERVRFVEGPSLAADQLETMFTPTVSETSAALWEHCVRAIEHASRFGVHGLPLMGNGDWNDGMNHVGAGGKGESVWLAWFLLSVLDQWIPTARQRNPQLAKVWESRAEQLAASVERHAWDGEWYLRAFFDDGSPLGSQKNAEAQIDSLPQSWAALSRRARPDRVKRALTAVKSRLLRPRDGLALLFTPPFDHSTPHPGYIMGYPPGMRENGGQYTHAAIWLAQALARQGDGAGAVELLQMINPVERTGTAEGVAKYRGEPYAVAADVSSAQGLEGAANWTWYTGSAGWMYRVWIEDILGFHLHGSELTIKPAIPETWPGYSIRYRHGKSLWRIEVKLVPAGEPASIVCDGTTLANETIPLKDDGREHSVQIRWSKSRSRPPESAAGVESELAQHRV